LQSQRIGDPKVLPTTAYARNARTLTLKKGGWFLSMRDRIEIGPYSTAGAAMTASRDLDARLRDVAPLAADHVIETFLTEQRTRLALTVQYETSNESPKAHT
jgi:hypothetical protein